MNRASTEHAFKETLPELITMDAIQIPSKLCFYVPAIPKKMIEKAMWYVEHQVTHVFAVELDEGWAYYVLRKDHTTGYKKIEKRLIEMFTKALQGEEDHRLKDLEHLTDVCRSMYLVLAMDEDWGVPGCDLNPCKLDCIHCKGFKGYGICSHVLSINHILKNVNLRRQLMTIGTATHKKGGGNRHFPIPALTRAPAAMDDSSDDEQAALLEQGDQGM